MHINQYLGDNTSTGGADGGVYYLSLDWNQLNSPSVGRLTQEDFPDAESDKLLVGILNVLYERTKDKSDDPNYRIVGTSVFQGRQTIGLENPVLMDTYDITFQIRLPSSSGTMPDPDDL